MFSRVTGRAIPFLLILALLPAPLRGEVTREVDELQIYEDAILLRSGSYTFRLTGAEARRLEGAEWWIDGDSLMIVERGKSEVLARAVPEPILPLPREPRETRRLRELEVDRMEDGILFRFRQEGAKEVYIEGTFNAWKRARGKMDRKDGSWQYELRLPEGTHHFRIRYQLEGDDHWFQEPEPEIRLTGVRRYLYTLEVGDHTVDWFVEEIDRSDFDAGLGGTYNRVEGLALSYRLGYEHGPFHRSRFAWTQGYSFAIERWSWEAVAELPIPPVPGLSFGGSGYDQRKIPLQWTVSEEENLLAALLITEDFYDYVWSRGWTVYLEEALGGHALRAGYREEKQSAVARNADWSLFGGDKTFRENLFSDSEGVNGMTHSVEGTYTFDSRNYHDSPTKGWLLRLHGATTGWELGGDYDYRRGVAEVHHYHKLHPALAFDFRLMGGATEGTPPLQDLFYLGGVGTMRAHEFKELRGRRFFLANLEYRASLWGDLQCAFFADLGDAWDWDGREKFDLESDMGLGLQNEDGDVRIDFARRLDEGAGDDITVTFRLNRMF